MMKQLSFLDPVEIPLTRGCTALVDLIDVDMLDCKWCASASKELRYARRQVSTATGPKIVYMHRVILERMIGRSLNTNELVDHINLNELDNRRSNLRLANKSGNAINRGLLKSNTSGVKGVSWSAQSKKWQVHIWINGKHIFLGFFVNLEDASAAYRSAAIELHGKFARIDERP